MGGSISKDEKILKKFYKTNLDLNEYITMKEFENFYLKRTGLRPSWKDWMKYMKCDLDNNFCITKDEFLKYFL